MFDSFVVQFVIVVLGLIVNLQGQPPDWQDFTGIVILLVINSTISFYEENNAGNAAAALMARLAPKAKVSLIPLLVYLFWDCSLIHGLLCFQVLRDGQWREEDASILVPGDIISVKLGDIIPADARLLEGDPLKIDQVLA